MTGIQRHPRRGGYVTTTPETPRSDAPNTRNPGRMTNPNGSVCRDCGDPETTSLAFGNANTGASVAKTVTIRNTGTANLKGLAVTRSGTNATDFVIGSLGATSLVPGASTTFKVTFKPRAAGSRSAGKHACSSPQSQDSNQAIGGFPYGDLRGLLAFSC